MKHRISFSGSGLGRLWHNTRDKVSKNVDESRIKDNIIIKQQTLAEAYEECFGAARERYNAKQKRADRKIPCTFKHFFGISPDSHQAGAAFRNKNKQKSFHEEILQVGTRTSAGVGTADGELAVKCFKEFMQGWEKRNPQFHLFSAIIHLDEATPHLHINYLPVATGYKQSLDTQPGLCEALGQAGKWGKNDVKIQARWRKSEREVFHSLCIKHGLEIAEPEKSRGYSLLPDDYKAEVEAAKAYVEREIAVLESEADGKISQIAELDEQIGKKEGEVAGLDEQIGKKEGEVAGLDAIVERLTPQCADLQNNIAANQAEANKLKADAQLEADKIKADADKLKADAQSEADKLTAEAQSEADRLKADAVVDREGAKKELSDAKAIKKGAKKELAEARVAVRTEARAEAKRNNASIVAKTEAKQKEHARLEQKCSRLEQRRESLVAEVAESEAARDAARAEAKATGDIVKDIRRSAVDIQARAEAAALEKDLRERLEEKRASIQAEFQTEPRKKSKSQEKS